MVIRSNNTKREGIINALLSFDKYFRVDPDFKMYGNFDGYENVLFNVSGTFECRNPAADILTQISLLEMFDNI